MKLLLDQNLSHRLCKAIQDIFPESSHVSSLGLATSDDQEVWDHARVNGYVIVTHDSDFADLSSLRGFPPKVVWLRCGNQPSDRIEALLRKNHGALMSLLEDDDAACLEIY